MLGAETESAMKCLTRHSLLGGLLPLLFLVGCAAGPYDDYPRSYSEAMTDTNDTRLGQGVDEWQDAHPDLSGFYPLIEGIDALGARLAMIEQADRCIDAQ